MILVAVLVHHRQVSARSSWTRERLAQRITWVLLTVVLVWLAWVPSAQAHEFRPGLVRVDQREDDPTRYDLRLVLPAVSEAGVIGPDELRPIVPDHCTVSPRSELAFVLDCGERGLLGPVGVAGLERHGIDVLFELRYADATRFVAVLGPDQPTVTLRSDDAQHDSVFSDYLRLGVEHILLGLDHLLFVLALVLLVRARSGGPDLGLRAGGESSTRALIATVTAFTVAHSVTLAASTLDVVSLPSAPVEAGIALSILLLARELALGPGDSPTLSWRYPWAIAFGFGLLHGFGFAGALREIGLPPSETPLALLAFNLGVEAGQLGVVAVLLLAITGLGRLAARLELPAKVELIARNLAILTIGGIAFAWTLERVLGFGA